MLVMFMVLAILQVNSLGILNSVFFKKRGGGHLQPISLYSLPQMTPKWCCLLCIVLFLPGHTQLKSF